MTGQSEDLRPHVHPHQIEVQEFDSYDLVVDLRDPAAYRHDHIPGAINVPWTASVVSFSTGDDDAAGVTDGAQAQDVPPGGLYALQARLGVLNPNATVLLYSGGGGADSAVAADAVAHLGLTIDVLAGGWVTYRRWVTAGLSVLGSCLQTCWVRSVPCGLSQALLSVLQGQGEQVCCFWSMLGPGALPGLVSSASDLPSQAAFETRLLHVLRQHDPARIVWFDEVHGLGGRYRLPGNLMGTLESGVMLKASAPLDERVRLASRHAEEARGGRSWGDFLHPVLDAVDGALAAELGTALGQGQVGEALATLLGRGIDPLLDVEPELDERTGIEVPLPVESVEAAALMTALQLAVPELLDPPAAA